MTEAITIRVAAPIADDLLAAGLAQPIPNDSRSAALNLVVDLSVIAKDVSSVVLTVTAGVRGLRAILDRLQRDDRDDEILLTINSSEGQRSWPLRVGEVDDATKQEIASALDALGPAGEPRADSPSR